MVDVHCSTALSPAFQKPEEIVEAKQIRHIDAAREKSSRGLCYGSVEAKWQ